MPDDTPSAPVFDRLAAIFAPLSAARRSLLKRTPLETSIWSLPHPPSNQMVQLRAVKIGKRSVSFHLIPIYVRPDLAKGMSPELRKRM